VLTLLFARVRSVVSIVIVLFGPLFFFRCAGFEIRGMVRAVVLGVAAAITIIIGILLFAPNQILAFAVTPSFNLYLSILSWLAFSAVRRTNRAAQRPMLPLLLYSGVAYAVLSAFGILLRLAAEPEHGLIVNAIAVGTFLFGWAILMIRVNMRWISRASTSGTGIPDAYLTDYRITKREAEVLALLMTGLTSGEIGEKLFISQRTVEAHIQNMYGKCNVGNRVELMAKITSYSSGGN
jgi:DNA-binding CsgD family transcriptional regulator